MKRKGYLRNSGKRWNAAGDNYLGRMIRDNSPLAYISFQLGRSHSSIKHRISFLNAIIRRSQAATNRARRILRQGDRIGVTRCMGVKICVTFSHWEGDWICSRKLSDIHATHIFKINGKPKSFA